MMFTRKLLTTFIATFIVFFIVNKLFGNYLVFGTMNIPFLQAMLTAAFGVALAASCVKPILHDDAGLNLTDQGWMATYLVINMGVIFAMARTPLSNSIGIGVIGFWVSLLLGVLVTGIQYLIFRDALHPKKAKR